MNPRSTLRSVPDTIETLRNTLQKLEQNLDPTADAVALADLKRVVLNRIAELEIVKALAPEVAESPKAPDPTALLPPSAETGGDLPAADAQTGQLEKLD
jgi:hypothetical protein